MPPIPSGKSRKSPVHNYMEHVQVKIKAIFKKFEKRNVLYQWRNIIKEEEVLLDAF